MSNSTEEQEENLRTLQEEIAEAFKELASLGPLYLTPEQEAESQEAWRKADEECQRVFAEMLRERGLPYNPPAEFIGPIKPMTDEEQREFEQEMNRIWNNQWLLHNETHGTC